ENPAWARDVARAGEMQVQPRASQATLGAVLDQSRKRAALSPLFVSLLLVACGPDSQELPPPGVYHFEAVTLENDCNPRLDDVSRGDEVVSVGDDRFNFPIFDYLCVSSEGEECFVTTTYAHQIANREPDTGVYSFGFDWV